MLKRILPFFLAVVLLSGCTAPSGQPSAQTPDFSLATDYVFADPAAPNALMGFAPQASYEKAVGDNTLVYLEVLWKDIEPEEGVFDFTLLEKENNLARWRQEGKHAVLRFICDKPSDEAHIDLPAWLYSATEDGLHYDADDRHKGYSPNYANHRIIRAHARAIEALGQHFNDGFVRFVELGSLGHWGEWHVHYTNGAMTLPDEATRELYILPYLTAFPQAKLLMRRPFRSAAAHGLGLYDDSAGDPDSTGLWLDWIQNGGNYSPANEQNALVPMQDGWKTAPIGGELCSKIPLLELITERLHTTVSLLTQSHTTFLGPHFPNGLRAETGAENQDGIRAVLSSMGYKLWVSHASCCIIGGEATISLIWKNSGNAPFYFNWPAFLYLTDCNGMLLGKYPIPLKASGLLPDQAVTTTVQLPQTVFDQAAAISVGIEDPMTARPAVRLAMTAEETDLKYLLWQRRADGTLS